MKIIIRYMLLVVFAVSLVGCNETPFTGRSSFNVIPASVIDPMGAKQFDQFLKENKLSTDKVKTAKVKNIGKKIQVAVQKFSAKNGIDLKNYEWQFELIEDKTVNAFAMPGGKVVVYTGIMKIANDDDMLAAIIGHEIAHVIAKHGAERMTQQLLISFGGMALSQLAKEQPEETQSLINTVYGTGAQVGVALPFSRKHENEADRMGAIFMSMAGYNPEKSIELWQKMAELSKGKKSTPEFMSTHPSNQTRIDKLKEVMPEAKSYAPGAKLKYGSEY